VHGRLKSLAQQEGVSQNPLWVAAASIEVVRQKAREFFMEAAGLCNVRHLAIALAAVPDVEPVPGDEVR